MWGGNQREVKAVEEENLKSRAAAKVIAMQDRATTEQ